MAQAAVRYADMDIYEESLAYTGVGTAVPQREYEQEQQRREQEHERARRRAKARADAKAQSWYNISVAGVVGFVVIVVLLLAVLVATVNYTEMSDSVVKLQQRLEELNDTEKKLKIQYEKAFDINEIESYAVNELHMAKPAADQVATSAVNAGNRAEIIAVEGEGEGFFSSVSTFISSLIGYFK